MPSLSSALNYALAGLSTATTQSALVSRNISSAGDANYVRRNADITSLPSGAPVVSRIIRNADQQLLDRFLSATSIATGKQILASALDDISRLTGDPEDDLSIASSISALQLSLDGLESNPSNGPLAREVLESARTVANRLNSAALTVDATRRSADESLDASVQKLNSLLGQFKVLNDSAVRSQGSRDEILETLDQRDAVLKLISEEIGIRTITKPNNDIQIYTESGVTLFDGQPRSVSFAPTSVFGPGQAGAPVKIDGVPVTGDSAPMPITSGRISAYAELRDSLTRDVSRQLDMVAGGLIRLFSEDGISVPADLPPVEGLFKGDGSIPSAGSLRDGLASRIRINELADPDQGGTLSLIRDGGFGGPDYVENTGNQAGYQKRIAELSSLLDLVEPHGQHGGIGGDASIKSLSLQSIAWMESRRQDMNLNYDSARASAQRASDSLARQTGVNIDMEMATLMELEKSFQASSRVLSVVQSMLSSLLEAVN